jgi:hypothetical protein
MGFFSEQELARQASGNAAAIFAATVTYLRGQGIDPHGWTQFLGKAFAPGWGDSCAASAEECVRLMARNPVSMGGTLERIDGDVRQATGAVTWPPVDLVEEIGVTTEDADRLWDVYGPIADHLGVDYEWHRRGPVVEFSVSLRR